MLAVYSYMYSKIGNSIRYLGDFRLLKYCSADIQQIRLDLAEYPVEGLSLEAQVQIHQAGIPARPLCASCGKKLARWDVKLRDWIGCSAICQRKLTSLRRYGHENVASVVEVKAKAAQTNLERYGTVTSLLNPDVQAKAAKTNLERYGTIHPMQSKEILERQRASVRASTGVDNPMSSQACRDRMRQTFLQHYGVENPMLNAGVRARQQATLQANYGVSNPSHSKVILKRIHGGIQASTGFRYALQSPQIQQKFRDTCKARYGVDYPIQSNEIKLRLYWSKRKPINPKALELISSRDFWLQNQSKMLIEISEELNIPISTTYYFYHYVHGFNCPVSKVSQAEYDLRRFLAQYYEVQPNVPMAQLGDLQSRLSLDCYIPELKLAFEYNGVYWHSEEYRGSKYHLQKTLACEQLGIRLVHIWEDDWLNHHSLMLRKLLNLIGKADRRVYARQCQIVIPTKAQKAEFYGANHVKGSGGGSVDYALMRESEIVAMISFRHTSQGWDLNRYATSCNVPGGFSRLLKHFQRNHEWTRIYTFADRSWSQGNVYLRTGFQLVEEQPPTWYGVEDGLRINRLQYIHEKLQQRFPDLHGTQFEIMDQAGIRRIWDCGQLKFELLNFKEIP